MTEPFWTKERLSQLTQLTEAGHSRIEVARILGCSRSAVIGKLRRMEIASGKLIGRSDARASSRTGKGRPADAADSKSGAARVVLAPVERQARIHHADRPNPLPSTVAVSPRSPVLPGVVCGILETTGCRWAVGHSKDVAGGHLFCNAVALDGQSYCEAHRREGVVAYSAPMIRKTLRGLPV